MARKDHPESSPEGRQAKADAEKADSAVSKQVSANLEQELEQGFRGAEVDPTPNENYTAAGVVANKPTPETDPDCAKAVGSAKFDASRF